MSQADKRFIVTANDLFSGDVVYFTERHDWAGSLADAAIATDKADADALLALANIQQDKIVGPYTAEVMLDADGVPQPTHFREVFRTRGPSNYFHGKQAEV